MLITRTNSNNVLYLVDDQGISSVININGLPEIEKFSEGIALSSVIGDIEKRKFIGLISSPQNLDLDSETSIVTVSKSGMIKRSNLNELPGLITDNFVLSKINKEDKLIWVGLTNCKTDLMLLSSNGMAIRFHIEDVREMGLNALGVNGMKLKNGDYIVDIEIISDQKEICLISDQGYGWRYSLDEISTQRRYGQGIRACKLSENEKMIGMIIGKPNQTVLIHPKNAASKLIRLDGINKTKRMRSSQIFITMKKGDLIQKITKLNDNLKLLQ